jgi:hypothetical protein
MFPKWSKVSQDKSMKETPVEFCSRIGGTVSRFLDIMAYLASPRLIAKYPGLSPGHLLEHIDGFLAIVDETRGNPDDGFTKMEPHALKLREMCRQWQDPSQVPMEMTLEARELIRAIAFGEPPGGWDAYEGDPDE